VAFLVLLANASSTSAADELTLTVVVSGPGEVIVAPTNVTCDSTCTATVPVGTEVTIRATPFGSAVVRWHDSCDGTKGDTCVLHPDTDATVTVVFALPLIHATTTTATTTATEPATTAVTTTEPTPTTTQPTTPHNTKEMAWAAIEQVTKDLRPGSAAFTTPEKLGPTETAEVEFLVTPGQSVTEAKSQLTEAGTQEGAPVQVSDYMRADLTGKDFDIVRVGDGDGRKIVLPDRATRWQWEITPRRTGVLRLHMTLTALVKVAGDTRELEIVTFKRTLSIHVAWPTKVKNFVDDNWKWLWTTIVVPAGVWAFDRRRRSKHNAPPPAEPAAN